MLKVRELPEGAILWYRDTVLGVKGMTLSDIFDECNCVKIGVNRFDYELLNQEFTEEQLAAIKEAEDEWNIDEDQDGTEEEDLF